MIELPGPLDEIAICWGGMIFGAFLYRLGSKQEPEVWELEKRPSGTGVEIWAKKGKKETCLHRIAYNRARAARLEDRRTEFDEQFAEALAQARSFIRSMNASERE